MKGFIFSLIFVLTPKVQATCQNWNASYQVAELSSEVLDEESGMQYSKVGNQEYLYHNNDSGGGPYIYRSNLDGSNLRKIKINGYSEVDPEAISVGNCPTNQHEKCLYLADIGDNRKIRRNSQIIIIKENDLNKDTVTPIQIVTFQFPRKTDAESFAVHPNGDIFLATKEKGSSNLFKLSLSKGVVLENIGSIDFTKIEGLDESGRATDMSISPDGKSFVLLTYQDAVFFNIDLSKKIDKKNIEIGAKALHLEILPKQESITFVGNDRLLYSTEAKEGSTPIYEASCLK